MSRHKQNNAAIFDHLWKTEAYVNLHRAKDRINPFSTPPGTPERVARLAEFDRACAEINEYERKAGVR